MNTKNLPAAIENGRLPELAPEHEIEHATRVATALVSVLEDRKLYLVISGRKYVLVTGWKLLAKMVGIDTVDVVWTRKTADGDGWEARVETFYKDGRPAGSGEAQCLRAERNWNNRDDFALRSMAQTRATGKALRNALDYIVQMAGYEATPAEEMVSSPAPAKTADANEPISEPQIKLITRLRKKAEKEHTVAVIANGMKQAYGTPVTAELTKAQAVDFTTRLKAAVGE